jgi:ABC-2 type transport system permease protein
MIAIIVIFISILFANIVTLSEVNSKAFFRNLLAPVNRLTFVFGLVLTTLVIVFFQILVLLLVGQFSFGIDVFTSFGSLALIIVLLSLFFLMLGMIIAILIRSEQSSVLTTTFVALGFFLFSNSVTPIEIMPKIAGFFASANPYVIATTAFRKVLIFGLGPQLLLPELLQLGAYLIVGLIVLILVSRRKLKN